LPHFDGFYYQIRIGTHTSDISVICLAIPDKLTKYYDHSPDIELYHFFRVGQLLGKVSDGTYQDRAGVVLLDEDVHGPHIDGLVNFVGVKVLPCSVGKSPRRCLSSISRLG
jgi:hypothetical protein